jgi:zinc protease
MKDDPAEYALLQSDLLTFAGTPYGHPPLGTLKTLSALTRDKVRDWYFQHLQHSRATWIAVGDVNAGDLAEVLGRKFSSFSNVKPRVLLSPARLSHVPKTHEERLKTQQANVVLGFRAPSMGTADFYVFRVLNTILNGMGGRLFVELREKKSLAYSVYSTLDAAASAGNCQIYIGCAPEKVEDAKRRLGMVLNSLAEKKVSPEELDRAKTYMVGLYQMGLQANRSQVHSYARYQMAGPGAMAVDRLPESIQKVTAEQVQAMARKCVSDPFKTWVVLTPAKGK